MKYAFIKQNKQDWPVAFQCRVLNVSRSGYYQWCQSDETQIIKRNQQLDDDILELFEQHKGRYGSPRITKALKDNKQCVNHKRVAKRMVALGLRAKQARKFKATTNSQHALPIAENLLQQDFSANKRNEKWVGDITYVWTTQGWLYLAIFIDVFSRQVISWSMSKRINKELVYAVCQDSCRINQPTLMI
ncbi:IS3 family transposase [Zooshikella ganghwensis]|uniref:IS3 family transposase n=1 Tax=Zooshikella ganghwensis TaxID=202772 RepID=UPI000B9E75BA|nr:IS3 family transposase [Zooshikella ganghwensis]